MTSTTLHCSKVLLVCLAIYISHSSYGQSLQLSPVSPILAVDQIDEVYYSHENIIYVVTQDYENIGYSDDYIDWTILDIPNGKVSDLQFFDDGSLALVMDESKLYVSRDHSNWEMVYEGQISLGSFYVQQSIIYLLENSQAILTSDNYGQLLIENYSDTSHVINSFRISNNYIFLEIEVNFVIDIKLLDKDFNLINIIETNRGLFFTNYFVNDNDILVINEQYYTSNISSNFFHHYDILNGGYKAIHGGENFNGKLTFCGDICYINRTYASHSTFYPSELKKYNFNTEQSDILTEEFPYLKIKSNGENSIAFNDQNLVSFSNSTDVLRFTKIHPKIDVLQNYDQHIVSSDGHIYIRDLDNIYLNNNRGKDWELLSLPFSKVNEIKVFDSGTLYILSDEEIAYTVDNGKSIVTRKLQNGGDGNLIIVSDDFLCIDHPNYQIVSRDRGLTWSYNISNNRIKKGTYYNQNGVSYFQNTRFDKQDYSYEPYLNVSADDFLYIDSSLLHIHNSNLLSASYYTTEIGGTIFQATDSPKGKLLYGPNRESTYIVDIESQTIYLKEPL